MRDQKRLHLWLRRLGQLSLAVALLCATALSARADGQAEIPQPVIPKPVVTVQGNLVVDNGKPTGFYELALCVRSGRTIVETVSGSEVTEAAYEADIAAAPDHATDGTYTITYYPFRTVAGTMNINTDVLTPVSWNLTEVTYGAWDKTTSQYTDPALNTASAARGIDLTATLDPDLYPDVDPDTVADYITDVTTADLNAGTPVSVRLEAAGDPRMTNVTAQADHYTADPANPENNSALITLSAATTDNKSVILKTDTPVVVVRFAYDLNRFSGLTTVNSAVTGGGYNSITGDTTDPGFWLGGDANDRSAYGANKTPLTWLAQSDASNVANPFDHSDKLAAATRNHQVIWYSAQCGDKAELDRETTQFYYYLGANGLQNKGTADVLVETPSDPYALLKLTLPRTGGYKVLTEDPNSLDPEASGYTYFQNLLVFNDGSLKLKLVNAPTFRKPAGKGGTMVLFYDWDDSFLGSMLIGKGDVRAEVNEYVEKNMVHPDLRAGQYLEGGNIPTDPTKLTEHQNLTDSLDREYTYRGKYSSKVDGSGVTRPDDPDPNASWANNDPTTPGSEYKLTNKLDYAFYRHLDTVTTLDYTNAAGNAVQERYVTSAPLSSDPEAALYPWVYGWAVVEDNSARNLQNWQSRRDSAQLENVWTTIGVGELAGLDPAYDTVIDNNGQGVPTSLPSGATPPAGGTGITTTYPAFIDASMVTAPTVYSYVLTGESGYLRMADFSDAESLLTREGQDTIIVKAVYEPGTSLADGNHYTLITEPAYTKWNPKAAADGGAYKVQLTMERSFNDNGTILGTTRVRMPVVRQDNTIDYKWLSDAEKGVNNDLDNVDLVTARGLTQTTYTKVDYDTGEIVTFSMAVSARQNKVDYMLLEQFGYNFVTGTQRSYANTEILNRNIDQFVVDNYNYYLKQDSDTLDDLYDCDFSTKEGSHGFVLYGTLGHFLEQATQYNRGEISKDTYENAVNYEIAPDANLRMTAGGAQPDYSSDQILRDAFIAAAKKCEAHKNDPAYDCWDENLNCAKLTYHQAQWFLLDYQANPGADILTVAAADAQKLSFCHYHISCSGGHIPAPPTGWKSLVDKLREYNDAAAGSDDRANARADLDAMELATLEGIAGLRANGNGSKYSSVTAYVDALLAADAQLKAQSVTVNWPTLQYAILNGAGAGTTATDMREEAQEKYWWYNGANSAPRINDFQGLLDAAANTYIPVSLKDGDTTFLPKSALSAAVFPNNAISYLTEADPTRGQRTAWVTLTDNLVPSHSETLVDPDGTAGSGDESYLYDYGKFTDIEDFRSKFTSAYDALHTDIDGGATAPADKDAWWRALQTKLLPDGDDLGDYDGTGDYTFWWKSGNAPFRVNNLSTLVECVRRLGNMSDPDAYTAAVKEWDRLTVADIESDAISQGLLWKGNDASHPLYPTHAADLAADEAGQKTAILNQLKAAVASFDASGAALNWENIQYLLLNPGALPDISTIDAQSVYYWWKNCNTTGTTVVLNIGAKETLLDINIQTLIKATYRAAFNDPGITKSLTDEATNAGNSFWDYTRLAKGYTAGTKFPGVGSGNDNDPYDGPDVITDLSSYDYGVGDQVALLDDLAAFRDVAKAAQGITDAYGVPAIYWHQVQYYLFHRTDTDPYIATTSQTFRDLRDRDKAVAGDYWWYYVDERVPPEPPKPDGKTKEDSDVLLTVLEDIITGKITAYGGVPTTITDFNGLQIFNTKKATDNTASLYATNGPNKTKNQTAMRKKLIELADAVKAAGAPYYDASAAAGSQVTLYWSQIQYWWFTGSLVDKNTAIDAIVSWGWTVGDGKNSATKNYIPSYADMTKAASLFADLPEEEVPTLALPDEMVEIPMGDEVMATDHAVADTPSTDAAGDTPAADDTADTPSADDTADTPPADTSSADDTADTPPADTSSADDTADTPSTDGSSPEASVGAGSKPAREETMDDLLAQKAELERQLAELEEQIAALEQAELSAPSADDAGGQCPPLQDQTLTPAVDNTDDTPSVDNADDTPSVDNADDTPSVDNAEASVGAGSKPAREETPEDATSPGTEESSPEASVGAGSKPARLETPAEERAEIPLGDEAVISVGAHVVRPAAESAPLSAADRLLPGRTDALLPKRLLRLYFT